MDTRGRTKTLLSERIAFLPPRGSSQFHESPPRNRNPHTAENVFLKASNERARRAVPGPQHPPGAAVARAIWLRRSMRFSGTCPVRYMLHPMIGMRKLDVLEMNCARAWLR